MDIQRWMARRDPQWRELDNLLKQAESQGIRSLRSPEVRQLSSLYRSVSADLARAQTHQVGQVVTRHLQDLVTRSFAQIYQGSRRQEWAAVWQFYAWGLPKVLRQTSPYWGLAVLLFGLGMGIGWQNSQADPQFMALLVPEGIIEQVRDRGELWTGSIVGVEPLASSRITTNNLAVCFAAVAGGITAGLYTVFIMVLNGLLIGCIAVLVAQYQLAGSFWAFVFPHGSLELPAIFLAGGAGLLLARALLFPGWYRRLDALRLYGGLAVRLLAAVVPLLLLAGAIEGFISPQPGIPDVLKYGLGSLLFGLLISYGCRQPKRG
ncbi:MAG: stage II sporulation protein M [Cyanobacteriota bacterium]|nr:stage II sporulation protein M [Cyanobacteriota bacterium]